MNSLLIILAWILLFSGFYFIIFTTTVFGPPLGVVLVMISFLIPDQLEAFHKPAKIANWEKIFLGIWIFTYMFLNYFWLDAYLLKPYYNMALFAYFVYRFIQMSKK